MIKVLFLLCLIFPITPQNYQNCPRISVRKEVREASYEERFRYFRAVNELNRKKSFRGEGSRFDDFVYTHVEAVDSAHGTPLFFPWHRYFVYAFEMELKEIDPNVNVLYWDWSIDSQSPEKSIIFSDGFFGISLNNTCIRGDFFGNWQVQWPTPHCLTRNYDAGDKISAFYSPEALQKISASSFSYGEYRNNIESVPHGLIHQGIGSDMAIMVSPNDPIFYSHHAFVDKLWTEWQSRGQNIELYDEAGTSRSDLMQPWNITVGDILDIGKLCYTYSQNISHKNKVPPRPKNNRRKRKDRKRLQRNKIFKRLNNKIENNLDGYVDPIDRNDMNNLRNTRPLSKEWIQRNNLVENRVRKEEKEINEYIDNLNQNYESPFSLGNLESTLNELFDNLNRMLTDNIVPNIEKIKKETINVFTTGKNKIQNFIKSFEDVPKTQI